MKILHRFGYYLGGFSIGLVLLAFFLNGKKVSCDYGPEARVLKNINTKSLEFSDDVNIMLQQKIIDTTAIMTILLHGDINFSESDTRQKPCGLYSIEGVFNTKDIILTIANCDSTAIVKNIKMP